MADIIQIKKLLKDYYLGKQIVPVLKGINLTIRENEYAALMGPSGSGKSTLMNIIGCLDTPTGGEYILNNERISSLNEKELARIRSTEIGFVFQQFNLLPRLSALENVALPLVYTGMGKRKRENIAKDMLAKVDLADRWHHKPNELSGGQNQRVAIARALANNPSIILADEPTGNLDTKTSNEIMDIFEGLNNNGHTIVLVTHEEDIAARARRVIRLRDGLIESSEKQSPTRTTPTEPKIEAVQPKKYFVSEAANEIEHIEDEKLDLEQEQILKFATPPPKEKEEVERVEFDYTIPEEEILEKELIVESEKEVEEIAETEEPAPSPSILLEDEEEEALI